MEIKDDNFKLEKENESNHEVNNKKSYHFGDRIKLKRQSKVLCTIDEKWNKFSKLEDLLKLGTDAFVLGSEVSYDSKKEIISKIKYLTIESCQSIPIIFNLSYFRIYVSQIKESNEETLKIHCGETIYIIKKHGFANFHKSEKISEVVLNENELIKEHDNKNYNSIIDNKFTVNSNEKKYNTTESKELTGNKISEVKHKPSLIDIAKHYNNHYNNDINCDQQVLTISTEPNLNFSNCKPGMAFFLTNNELTLEVVEVNDNYLKCKANNSGDIYRHSTFSVFKENHYTSGIVNEYEVKLVKEIEEAISLGADYIIISIINDPKEEINRIKELLKYKKAEYLKIIVSLNTPESITLLDEFAENVDAIIFNRNELVLKDNLSKICYNQRQIISKCAYYSKTNKI
jgi:pyruvate kinase